MKQTFLNSRVTQPHFFSSLINRVPGFRQLMAFTFLFLIVSQPSLASMEDGIAAIEKQDYMTAYQIFKKLADKGEAEAQHNLAVLYKQGKGVMQDSKLALNWFEKAAAQGLTDAEYYLGHLYDAGEGVEKNPSIAYSWYVKAAEKGNPLAQSNLGVMYANGEGVKQDIILAYVWFSLAASQGLTAGLENRNLLSKDMSDELRKNAQKLTREYFQRYVAPFQVKEGRKDAGRRHPRLPSAHSQSGPRSSAPASSQQLHPPTNMPNQPHSTPHSTPHASPHSQQHSH